MGKVFGRLTVIGRDEYGEKARYLCHCTCGVVRFFKLYNLTRGVTRSCGCLAREHSRERATTYGKSHMPEATIWRAMKSRCQNPKNVQYASYGGRGIDVCARWQVFENFLEDMGTRPSDGHSIERMDNDKGYSPENCCWATRAVQSRNRRSNRIITYKGESMCLTDWAIRLGIKRLTLSMRFRRGASVEKAFSM